MLRFLVVVLSVYGAMHALFFFRIRVLLPQGWLAQGLFILFLALMIAAPFCGYYLERNGHDLPARWAAFIGFYWMGFIFISFWLALLMTTFDIFSWAANSVSSFAMPALSGKAPTLAMLAIAAALCAYGYFEAHDLRIERVRIETDKLPAGTDLLKIAQISDVHVGLLARNHRLKTIADAVQQEAPDILVCTGDLVDGLLGHLPELPDFLEQIHPPYGKYAVTGNHEFYAGLDQALEFLRRSGFTVLQGEARTINPLINIVGVDDPAGNVWTREAPLLSSVRNGLFTLLLKHRPLVSEESLGLFDLQLSGHVHRGQIFPFNFIAATQYPLLDGYYDLGKGSRLYTSRGSGAWGPQMRILSPPEVTIIELARKAPAAR